MLGSGSAGERLAFYAVSRLLGAASAQARMQWRQSLAADPSPLDGLAVDFRSGILLPPAQPWPVLEAAVAEASAAFDAGRAGGSGVNPGKTFMTAAREIETKYGPAARQQTARDGRPLEDEAAWPFGLQR